MSALVCKQKSKFYDQPMELKLTEIIHLLYKKLTKSQKQIVVDKLKKDYSEMIDLISDLDLDLQDSPDDKAMNRTSRNKRRF